MWEALRKALEKFNEHDSYSVPPEELEGLPEPPPLFNIFQRSIKDVRNEKKNRRLQRRRKFRESYKINKINDL